MPETCQLLAFWRFEARMQTAPRKPATGRPFNAPWKNNGRDGLEAPPAGQEMPSPDERPSLNDPAPKPQPKPPTNEFRKADRNPFPVPE